MGDEGNITSGFPFFFDLPTDVAERMADGRYQQMRDMFGEDVEPGDLPDPNDPATFQMAKLPWNDFRDLPGRRAALERFRTLAGWRRERLWPLAATPCLDARTARQGNSLLVSWQFEAGTLSMALNPTAEPVELSCLVGGNVVHAGRYELNGERLRLHGWSAVAW